MLKNVETQIIIFMFGAVVGFLTLIILERPTEQISLYKEVLDTIVAGSFGFITGTVVERFRD